MTLREAEDIARECKAAGSAFFYDYTGMKAQLKRAAEAIDWLLEQLNEAEGVVEWLEQFEP